MLKQKEIPKIFDGGKYRIGGGEVIFRGVRMEGSMRQLLNTLHISTKKMKATSTIMEKLSQILFLKEDCTKENLKPKVPFIRLFLFHFFWYTSAV